MIDPRDEPVPSLVRGIVVAEPNDESLIDVVVPVFDERQVFNDLVFMPRGDDEPAPGAECLVAFDERHAPWVVAWYGATVSETRDNGDKDEDENLINEDGPEGPTADGETGKVKPASGLTWSGITSRPFDAPSGEGGDTVEPKQYLMDFLELVAGDLGETVYINTFSNHNRLTSSLNVSDHWTGNGADVWVGGVDTELGNRICFHALRRCGQSTASATTYSTTSTPYTRFRWKHDGLVYACQILWKTDGDHHDHVHVGIRRANRGETLL